MHMINTFLKLLEFNNPVKRATRAITGDVGTKRNTKFKCACKVRIGYMWGQIGNIENWFPKIWMRR